MSLSSSSSSSSSAPLPPPPPLVSQYNLLNNIMFSGVALNRVGEIFPHPLSYSYRDPDFISLCDTVTALAVYMSFSISMYTYSITCPCNDVNIALV